MKTLSAGLLSNVVTSYDKTKTTILGRVFQKTIDGASVLGPPLTNFIDIFTDTTSGTSVTPAQVFLSPNGRLFVLAAPLSGAMTVLLYDFDLTGQVAPAYVGRIVLSVPNLAATTHTLRGFKVWDGANAGVTTGWKIAFATTGSVLINGGVFTAYNISRAQFVPISPPTIGMAVANNATAVYFHQDPTAIGVANNLTAMAGLSLDSTNQLLYGHNGTAAAGQFFKLDLSVSPTITNLHANGSAQTTLFAGTSPSAFFSTGAATSALQNNDPVIITSGAPANFVNSTAASQTVYFARDVQTVSGTVYFNLATTSGGAAVTPTSATTGINIMRAFGISTAAWTTTKTGNITGIAGTLLNNNSEFFAQPSTSVDPNIPAGLSGQDCVFFATTTGLYLFKASEITAGVTTLPSLQSVNVQGTGTDFTGITTANAVYSTSVGAAVYTSNTSAFYAKRWLNSQILLSFGGLNTQYWENMPARKTTNFSAAAITQVGTRQGWLLFTATTVGQRGVYYMDFRSDCTFDFSSIISRVLDTSDIQSAQFISTIEALFDYTNSMEFFYRTAATETDPIFASATSGTWTPITFAEILAGNAFNNFTQIKICFDIAQLAAQTPAQIAELNLTYIGKNEISDNWEGSVDNTTSGGASPARTAFRMTKAYSSPVPTLYFRAYDDNGNLVASANTASNPTLFEYSTNNGLGWSALGTIPNTPLTTELRYNWTSPPGVRVTCSLREA